MFEKLKTWFLHLVTEPDNKTHCVVRWTALFATAQGLGTHAYTIFFQHAAFDMNSYFQSIGIMITTLGVALGLKKDSQSGTDQ